MADTVDFVRPLRCASVAFEAEPRPEVAQQSRSVLLAGILCCEYGVLNIEGF
jgi:hypothetical protein